MGHEIVSLLAGQAVAIHDRMSTTENVVAPVPACRHLTIGPQINHADRATMATTATITIETIVKATTIETRNATATTEIAVVGRTAVSTDLKMLVNRARTTDENSPVHMEIETLAARDALVIVTEAAKDALVIVTEAASATWPTSTTAIATMTTIIGPESITKSTATSMTAKAPGTNRTRQLVLLSVWTVVLLGLPLWWKTTRVYRAELPYQDIEQWSQWKACEPVFPIRVQFHLSDTKALNIDALSISLEKSSRDRGSVRDLDWKQFAFLTNIQPIQLWTGMDLKDVTDRPSSVPGTYDFYIAPSTGNEGTRALIKSQRQGFIQVQTWDEANVVKAAVDTLFAVFGPQEIALKKIGSGNSEKKAKEQLKAVKYAPGYQLTFSLFSGDASNGVRGWKMQEAISAYMTPFVRSMSTISKFNIESQVQHYASLTFEPKLDPVKNEHYLTPDSLSNFINAAEWSLASTVSSFPPLNFLVYVPKSNDSPLVIKQGPEHTSTTDSFLIPRWGGITILNRSNYSADSDTISVKELEQVMGVFLTQLRDLLGVPDLPTSSKAAAKIPIHFQRHRNAAVPTTWELDYLQRLRWAENLVDSLSTLTSLARLVVDTPNMVVLDHIQKDVVEALKDIEDSCALMTKQEYTAALARSRDGLVKAETAFFDPTMVSMLYFPDEHKYAIYMPLFVPISVPLVMALLRELKKAKESKRAAAKEVAVAEGTEGKNKTE
ncbi:hypothetical protein BGZ81_000659 [Podila clonocystis]|nr:hypothetical protein BGZ81_000659 [Podila clonocystis]